MRKSLVERFVEKVLPPNEQGCKLWGRQKDKKGYGLFRFNNRHAFAHRVAWELAHGPIPKGKCVCHKCDVPSCVNVEHLFLGTQQDNLADMRSKGRHVFGSRHGNHKLTDEDVLFIKQNRDMKGIDLARMFKVTPAHISNIRNGKRRKLLAAGC